MLVSDTTPLMIACGCVCMWGGGGVCRLEGCARFTLVYSQIWTVLPPHITTFASTHCQLLKSMLHVLYGYQGHAMHFSLPPPGNRAGFHRFSLHV